jgi:hypothetical protein
MVFSMEPAVVGASAACESGLAAQVGAGAAAGAPALLAAVAMGSDADSLEFAAALQALGAAYVAAAGEHGLQREMFSAAQSAAAVTTVASEAARAATLAL